MRTTHLLPFCLAGIVAVAAVALNLDQALPAAAASNLIVNPGYETGDLSGWSCSSVDRVTSSPVHSGSHALTGAANSSDDAQCTQTVSLTPSTGFTLSAFVNGAYVYSGVSGTGTSDVNTWTPGTNGSYVQPTPPPVVGCLCEVQLPAGPRLVSRWSSHQGTTRL